MSASRAAPNLPPPFPQRPPPPRRSRLRTHRQACRAPAGLLRRVTRFPGPCFWLGWWSAASAPLRWYWAPGLAAATLSNRGDSAGAIITNLHPPAGEGTCNQRPPSASATRRSGLHGSAATTRTSSALARLLLEPLRLLCEGISPCPKCGTQRVSRLAAPRPTYKILPEGR
jgi:hypothetical protein